MNWSDLRIFCVAAGETTLSATAARLRLSVATVSRRMDTLEEAIGFRLFDRSANGIVLTTQGRALEASSARASEAIQDLDRLMSSLRSGIWPEPVRVSATEPVISEILAPSLPNLLRRFPAIRVDLVASSEIVSLAARNADIAVRFAAPDGNSLVAQRLPSIQMGLYGSLDYLKNNPSSSFDLKKQDFLSYDDSYGPIAELVWLQNMELTDKVIARMSSTRGLIAAVRAGAGLAVLPARLAESAGNLVAIRVIPAIPQRPVWLVTHRDFVRVKTFRLVRQWIIAAFGGIDGRQKSDTEASNWIRQDSTP